MVLRMLRLLPSALAAAAVAVAAGCGDGGSADAAPWVWDLPAGFPPPRVPEDNPMSAAKVELGRRLFHDTRLSFNETQSCASCHLQELAFTDGLARSVGSTGEVHPRSSMSLANVAYTPTMTWANPLLDTIESQALLPIFAEEPIVELGMTGREGLLLERLRGDADYTERFARAFPGAAEPVSLAHVQDALAAFQRTLISGDSAFDRATKGGDSGAMSASARRGMDLFFSERMECFHCHGGFTFSASVDHEGLVFTEESFVNNGLYDVDGRGAYPPGGEGLFEVTGDPQDMGKFKPPSLRNVAVTAPYMHDGSIATLEDVVDHYAAGGRNVTEGPWVGDGRTNPNKSLFVSGFEITGEEKADLVAFLESLTDDTFLTDPRFSDPFAGD